MKRATAAVGTLAAANMLLAACEAYPNAAPPPVVDENASAATLAASEPTATAALAGVAAMMVDYPGRDEEPLMGHLARPAGDEPRPIENKIYIYEGAQHAFFNDTRASSYDAEASAEAWTRTLDWFATYLGG